MRVISNYNSSMVFGDSVANIRSLQDIDIPNFQLYEHQFQELSDWEIGHKEMSRLGSMLKVAIVRFKSPLVTPLTSGILDSFDLVYDLGPQHQWPYSNDKSKYINLFNAMSVWPDGKTDKSNQNFLFPLYKEMTKERFLDSVALCSFLNDAKKKVANSKATYTAKLLDLYDVDRLLKQFQLSGNSELREEIDPQLVLFCGDNTLVLVDPSLDAWGYAFDYRTMLVVGKSAHIPFWFDERMAIVALCLDEKVPSHSKAWERIYNEFLEPHEGEHLPVNKQTAGFLMRKSLKELFASKGRKY